MVDSSFIVNHDSKDELVVGMKRQPGDPLLAYNKKHSTIRSAVVETSTKAAIIPLLFTIPHLSVQL